MKSKYVKEAARLLRKSIIHVETKDVQLPDNEYPIVQVVIVVMKKKNTKK